VGRLRLLPLAILAIGVLAVTQLRNDGGSASTPEPAAPAAPAEFFGLGISGTPGAGDVSRLEQSGATIARVTFDWRMFQPVANTAPAFDAVDPLIRRLAEARIEILPGFVGTPGWLAPDPNTAPLFSKEAREGWQRFLSAAVERYGPHGSFWSDNPNVPYDPIRYWQVWNEENGVAYFAPKPSPHAYAELLHISAAAIRGADPRATIVLGGMFQTLGTGGSILSWQFLRQLYAAGAAPDFDVVGVHPYDPTMAGVVDQIRKMRAAMDSNGGASTPLWVDEIGWGSARAGSKLNLGVKGQASMLTRALTLLASRRQELGIAKVIWYPLRDPSGTDVGACGFCDSAGLLDQAGDPKPSWDAYRAVATAG
jgi:polysaccharide biosynthesis protein PslG